MKHEIFINRDLNDEEISISIFFDSDIDFKIGECIWIETIDRLFNNTKYYDKFLDLNRDESVIINRIDYGNIGNVLIKILYCNFEV